MRGAVNFSFTVGGSKNAVTKMISAQGYAPLDDEVYNAAADAETALGAFASALVAIEAELDPHKALEYVRQCSARAERARQACRDFQVELQGATLPSAEFTRMAQEYDSMARRLQRHNGTLEFIRKTRQREALLASGQKDGDKATPAQLIALGMQIQAESQLAVARMTQAIEASKYVGAQTLATMEQQHGQLSRIRGSVDAQNVQFAHVERELRVLAQGVLSDSVTQVLLVVIVACIFFIITWRFSQSSDDVARRRGFEQGWRTVVLPALSLEFE